MSAPIKPIAAVEAHMVEQRAIATLLAARVSKPLDSESDRIAYADAAHLIETHAAVACDADYPQWAAELADLPTYYRTKETNR